jgi:hypothetical protein
MDTLISLHPEEKTRYQRLRGYVENNIGRPGIFPKLRRFNGGDAQIQFAMPMMMKAAFNAAPENLEMEAAMPFEALGLASPLGASGRGFLGNDDS